jgi:ribonuclease P protein component
VEVSIAHKLPHSDHLKSREDFNRVIRNGQQLRKKGLTLSFSEGKSEQSRIGFIVGKKVGSAPQRHRWRRLWKEAFRLERPYFSKSNDLVVLVRPHCPAMNLEDIRTLLKKFHTPLSDES